MFDNKLPENDPDNCVGLEPVICNEPDTLIGPTKLPVTLKLFTMFVLPDTFKLPVTPKLPDTFVSPVIFPLTNKSFVILTEPVTPNEPVICAEPLKGNPTPVPPPPNDDVATNDDLPVASPTHAYPSLNEAVKEPVAIKSPLTLTFFAIILIPAFV